MGLGCHIVFSLKHTVNVLLGDPLEQILRASKVWVWARPRLVATSEVWGFNKNLERPGCVIPLDGKVVKGQCRRGWLPPPQPGHFPPGAAGHLPISSLQERALVEESSVSGENYNWHHKEPEDDGLVHWEEAVCLGLNSLVNLLEKRAVSNF